jgi:hypothetical protein
VSGPEEETNLQYSQVSEAEFSLDRTATLEVVREVASVAQSALTFSRKKETFPMAFNVDTPPF